MSGGSTILIVDDEPDLADLYAVWLRDEHTVRTAYGGADALEVFEKGVDVAFIDRLMPRMSGTELLSHIRESGYDCRVAIVTAVEPDFDIIEMGFDEYLVKPVKREKLNVVTDSLITRSTYSEQLQEFFALASKRAALQAKKTPTQLDSNDDYVELVEELERLRADIEQTVEQLCPRDFDIELRRLESTIAHE